MKNPREAAAPSRWLRDGANNVKVLHHLLNSPLSDAQMLVFCRSWQVISTLLHCLLEVSSLL